MDNLLACNLGSYGPDQADALPHLASLGVRHVELGVPAPQDVGTVRRRLADHGLSASSVMASCPVGQPDLGERFGPICDAAIALGAKVVFISVHAGDIPLEEVFIRLRAAGDRALAAGVKLAMETHPDLCQNGTRMAETMAEVAHPAVGVNFDTANIYYYNEGSDAGAELDKAVEHVVSVHLKDTNGGFHAHHFPTIGQGVVDFPAIFAKLNAQGMYGPFTLELEGIGGVDLGKEGRQKSVADSVAWLRAKGLVP